MKVPKWFEEFIFNPISLPPWGLSNLVVYLILNKEGISPKVYEIMEID